jgi:PIN domain nuclease of toxin-antitoxin system
MNSSPNDLASPANDYVLDASALLALIQREPGADLVAAAIEQGRCVISTVNLAEVITRLLDLGITEEQAIREVGSYALEVSDFTVRQAQDAAFLRGPTRSAGLSLGDRACLAVAQELNMPAMTGDKRWASLDLGIEIELIR